MGQMRNAYKILVTKPEGKRPLEHSGIRQDNIKVDLEGTRWEGADNSCG
jgi:hypothetical protein